MPSTPIGHPGVGSSATWWTASTWTSRDAAACAPVRRCSISTLESLIAEQRAAGRPPVIVDVAAGPATYLVELLARDRGADLTALARDLDAHALERGRTLGTGAGVGDRLRYEQGDALDEDALVGLTPRPSIVIASGFYELLLDGSIIARSMSIARRLLAPGDPLVFTTQVAHPQIALMTVVPAHDGRPWIIRNRSLATVESIAHDAGFEDVSSKMEPVGIFAVSVAR